MDETKYAKAFELIMNAGNAKSLALMAVESAREFDFEEAQKQLKESQQEFHLAHQAQSDMIQGEANGAEHCSGPRTGSPDHGDHGAGQRTGIYKPLPIGEGITGYRKRT